MSTGFFLSADDVQAVNVRGLTVDWSWLCVSQQLCKHISVVLINGGKKKSICVSNVIILEPDWYEILGANRYKGVKKIQYLTPANTHTFQSDPTDEGEYFTD